MDRNSRQYNTITIFKYRKLYNSEMDKILKHIFSIINNFETKIYIIVILFRD